MAIVKITKSKNTLMEYITMCLDSTNKLENLYVGHNNVYCLHLWATCFNLYTGRLQALLYMWVHKSYARWDPIVLTSLKHINYVKYLCLSIKVKSGIAVFSLTWCRIRYGDLSYVDALIVPYFLMYFLVFSAGLCLTYQCSNLLAKNTLTKLISTVSFNDRVRSFSLQWKMGLKTLSSYTLNSVSVIAHGSFVPLDFW